MEVLPLLGMLQRFQQCSKPNDLLSESASLYSTHACWIYTDHNVLVTIHTTCIYISKQVKGKDFIPCLDVWHRFERSTWLYHEQNLLTLP
jgi:hypothetical protein